MQQSLCSVCVVKNKKIIIKVVIVVVVVMLILVVIIIKMKILHTFSEILLDYILE